MDELRRIVHGRRWWRAEGLMGAYPFAALWLGAMLASVMGAWFEAEAEAASAMTRERRYR